jgi:hypothetical protein
MTDNDYFIAIAVISLSLPNIPIVKAKDFCVHILQHPDVCRSFLDLRPLVADASGPTIYLHVKPWIPKEEFVQALNILIASKAHQA